MIVCDWYHEIPAYRKADPTIHNQSTVCILGSARFHGWFEVDVQVKTKIVYSPYLIITGSLPFWAIDSQDICVDTDCLGKTV